MLLSSLGRVVKFNNIYVYLFLRVTTTCILLAKNGIFLPCLSFPFRVPMEWTLRYNPFFGSSLYGFYWASKFSKKTSRIKEKLIFLLIFVLFFSFPMALINRTLPCAGQRHPVAGNLSVVRIEHNFSLLLLGTKQQFSDFGDWGMGSSDGFRR